MFYAFAAFAIIALGIITTLIILLVRARDQLRKVEVKTVLHLRQEISELTRDKEVITVALRDHEDTIVRERAAKEVLRKRLTAAEEMVAECTDPLVLSKRLTDFFTETPQ